MKTKTNLLKIIIGCVYLVSFFQNTCVSAELFTSTSSLEDLVYTMKKVTTNLDAYFEYQQSISNTLNTYLNLYKSEYDKAIVDIPDYIGNPINVVKLLIRMSDDLAVVKESIESNIELSKMLTDSFSQSDYTLLTYDNNSVLKQTTAHIQNPIDSGITKHIMLLKEYNEKLNLSATHSDMLYPNTDDLLGAARGLMRLKSAYNLTNEELSEGKMNGVSYSSRMTISDCYEIGLLLYDIDDKKNAIEWMMIALNRFVKDDETYHIKITDIMEYLIRLYYDIGDISKSLQWTEKLLKIDPTNERMYESWQILKKMKAEQAVNTETLEDDITIIDFHKVCREELTIPQEVAKKLKCFYRTETHPFLKIAPIKAEQMYDVPEILLFHDIISDEENAEIVYQAKVKRLERSKVGFSDETATVADFRTSKQTWLHHDTSDITERVVRRIEMATGFDLSWSEQYQVANYGIGGHYDPHYDFPKGAKEKMADDTSNRIATLLFYLTTVELGGGTAFPYLGVHLRAVKNSAAFWPNLLQSGEGDLSVLHGACPVLKGSKWVSTLWIRTNGQELTHPCETKFQPEEFIREQPFPVLKNRV